MILEWWQGAPEIKQVWPSGPVAVLFFLNLFFTPTLFLDFLCCFSHELISMIMHNLNLFLLQLYCDHAIPAPPWEAAAVVTSISCYWILMSDHFLGPGFICQLIRFPANEEKIRSRWLPEGACLYNSWSWTGGSGGVHWPRAGPGLTTTTQSWLHRVVTEREPSARMSEAQRVSEVKNLLSGGWNTAVEVCVLKWSLKFAQTICFLVGSIEIKKKCKRWFNPEMTTFKLN